MRATISNDGDAQPGPQAAGGELAHPMTYEPRATQQPRRHVYCVRFDDQEMAGLQTLARRRGVPVSVVLRELIRDALSPRVKLTED